MMLNRERREIDELSNEIYLFTSTEYTYRNYLWYLLNARKLFGSFIHPMGHVKLIIIFNYDKQIAVLYCYYYYSL